MCLQLERVNEEVKFPEFLRRKKLFEECWVRYEDQKDTYKKEGETIQFDLQNIPQFCNVMLQYIGFWVYLGFRHINSTMQGMHVASRIYGKCYVYVWSIVNPHFYNLHLY